MQWTLLLTLASVTPRFWRETRPASGTGSEARRALSTAILKTPRVNRAQPPQGRGTCAQRHNPQGTAILFLNCLCRWVLCNSSRSTAYFNRSFFCTSRLNSAAFAAEPAPSPAPAPAPEPEPETARAAPPRPFRASSELIRPSCKSHFAFRPCSRRASLSTWLEAWDSRCEMLGEISSRRDCWASRRVGSGRSSKCFPWRAG